MVKMNFLFVYLTQRILVGSNEENRLTRRTAFGIRLHPVFGRPFGWRRLTAVISEKLDVVPDIDNNLISIDIDLSAEMKGVKIKPG